MGGAVMKTVLAIDPGPEESAYVVWDGRVIRQSGMFRNETFRDMLFNQTLTELEQTECWIETMQSYGTVMGKSTIDTLIWIGRLMENYRERLARYSYVDPLPKLVTRPTIKTHICGTAKANDSHIREALICRVGPQGTRRSPGPTYGMVTHKWAALAVGIYGWDISTLKEKAGAA